MKIKLFADGADLDEMRWLSLPRSVLDPDIAGFTTNPTLMRKARVTDYESFARQVVAAIPDKPISFEVCADDLVEMERQARVIASWGEHVYVKIPCCMTNGATTASVVRALSHSGVKVNVTAVMSLYQIALAVTALTGGAPSIVSVFAGRIADTGRDPVPVIEKAVKMVAAHPQIEILWASPRELLNVFQAEAIGCHIITASADILKKLHLVGKDLDAYSIETVKMFRDDAIAAGYTI